MADTTPGGGTQAGGAGFGKFIAGLVLGIVIGGFAGAFLTPMVGNQPFASGPSTARPPGPSSHDREQEEARRLREEADAAARASEGAGKPNATPTPPGPGVAPPSNPPTSGSGG